MDEKTVLLRKRQRQALLTNCAKEIKNVDDLTDPDSEESAEHIQVTLAKLNDYRTRLSGFNDEILLANIDEDAAGAEAQRAADFDENILGVIVLLSTKLQNYERSVAKRENALLSNNASQHSLGDHKAASVKLPKLLIAKFGGDPLKWQEFWDSYSTTIHDNDDLSAIDKFKYSRSFLTGDALRFVEGYRLTTENYETVVETLAERFGNKQIAIFSHFEAMLALPIANHETHQLQNTYDECERHIRSLIALGLAADTFGQVFTPIILSKLPIYVKMELHRKNGASSWTLQNLRSLLKEEIRARDMSQRSFGAKPSIEKQRNSRDDARHHRFQSQKPNLGAGSSASLLADAATRGIRCSLCSENHYTDQCKKYPDVNSRKQRVKGRCFICLSSKHMAPQCPARQNPCFHCQKEGHHRALCPTKFNATVGKGNSHGTTGANTQPTGAGANYVNSTLLSHGEQVILQTALAKIQGTSVGRPIPARLLFDTGCSRTFITARMAKQIGAQPHGEEVISVAGFADRKRKTVNYKIVTFDVIQSDGSIKSLTANVTPTISCPIQKLPINVDKYPMVRNMVLAEPKVINPEMVTIDVLIGSDYYYDFVGTDRVQCSDGLIFLSSSLGFIVTGRVEAATDGAGGASTLFLSGASDHFEMAPPIERFWSLEDIGVKPPVSTNDDEEALQAFNATVKCENGRYEVTWPWKNESPDLPENFPLACGRLKSLLKRLSPDEKLFELYDQTILEQETKGIIERAPSQATGDKIHYIPHHAVVSPSKVTTKLRVVYDASAKATKTSPSLNECLHRGPVMLDDLCGLLMRFRLQPIGIVSDIEKAFLQVGLQACSRDVTRFLWVKDPNKPPTGANLVTYRFCRVPFGVISSPFLLAATIEHHIKNSKLPVAADIIGNIYVDNIITGKTAVDAAQQFYAGAKNLFLQASMNLREWYTNNDDLMSVIKPADRGRGSTTKVLGLTWDTKQDTLSCSSFKVASDTVNTKRLMLKHLAKVFDPCGYFSAVTVAGKMMIQKLWQQKFGWDDQLPADLISEWQACSSNLQQISSHELARCNDMHCHDADAACHLHCFCDASAKAYSAVVYLKVTTAQTSSVGLVFAKSRVAPIKPLSIPRLELMATLIGTRLVIFVEKQLRIPISQKTVWSDSQCVLHWLVKQSISTTFVKNRVREITSHQGVTFRYVPTAVNPADLSSRGCTFAELVDNPLWWRGPPFLTLHSSQWPPDIDRATAPLSEPTSLVDPEMSPNDTVLLQTENETVIKIEHFSSLTRLLRVTCWVKRFINNAQKTKVRDGCLTADEMAEAQIFWERCVQKASFSDILCPNPSKSATAKLAQLEVFVDNEGLLRCGGRYQYADIADDAKCPKLLPKSHPFTDLVILDCHQKLLHSGVGHTLAQLRYRYWVIHGRIQVKKVINGCRICVAVRGGPFRVPPFPPLPNFRATQQRPFSRVGVDYLGPLRIKSKITGDPQKVWICLFTCAVIRAVHLEVVDQLSSQQFLLCLRRFTSLRGRPDLIVSDNAKQFHTANNTLRKLWRDVLKGNDVQDFSTTSGIKWKFITELSPWMGGFYERMVGIVKRALKNALDMRCVSFVELQTVMSEVASVVNSRPLYYSEASFSEPPLTPSHFLGGVHCSFPHFSLEEGEFPVKETKADDLIQNWKRIQGILDSFWHTWRSQYLLGLRTSAATFKQRNASKFPPTVGSVVLVKDNLPRNLWKMGVITELRKSVDGVVRSVSLRLPNHKIINRPLRLLYPLEISSETADSCVRNSSKISKSGERPKRNAAKIAANRIKQVAGDEALSSDDSE